MTAVREQVRLLSGTEVVISSNLPLRRDGMPYARETGIRDFGAAVYFNLNKRPVVFACDRWDSIAANVRAIAKTVEALRGIERWGSGDMARQAFTGFVALPPIQQWWQVLEVPSTATQAQIEDAYRRLASAHHPDKLNGDADLMARINRARDQAMERFT
jgi:hypothetical protein